MRLATTTIQHLEGPFGNHRIGHDAGHSWSAITRAICDDYECEESDVGLLEADEDEGRDFDQVTVNGKPVANILGTEVFIEPPPAQSNSQQLAAE